ncbi:hypothetical protein Pla52n_68260 [Stieleria varia]|uniref:Uncharacterized protein n=2 Tax=Stieleria varia TaxID=2528005 RepID=A0A5C5ZQB6_9BACT|nr:hypothetical protein Pla52n_68260 [Stieleria varia]
MSVAKKKRIPNKFRPWIEARKKFRLSHAHIQMARELGLSPKRFAAYADTTNQPWKVPLPQFIEQQYLTQFGKERPDEIKSIERIAEEHQAKRAERKLKKQAAAGDDTQAADSESTTPELDASDSSASDEQATEATASSDDQPTDS